MPPMEEGGDDHSGAFYSNNGSFVEIDDHIEDEGIVGMGAKKIMRLHTMQDEPLSNSVILDDKKVGKAYHAKQNSMMTPQQSSSRVTKATVPTRGAISKGGRKANTVA